MNEICTHCHQKIRERWESLSRGLIKDLVLIGEARDRKGINEIHLQKDLTLSKNEYNNCQKLRYFGLIAKTDKPGYWLLTRLGSNFLYNNEFIPKKKFIRNNRVVPEMNSEEYTNVAGVMRREKYWNKLEDYSGVQASLAI